MEAAILFVSLVAGYLYTNRIPNRYFLVRTSPQKIYFNSAKNAVFLFLWALSAHVAIAFLSSYYRDFFYAHLWLSEDFALHHLFVMENNSLYAIAIYSFFTGYIIPKVFKFFWSREGVLWRLVAKSKKEEKAKTQQLKYILEVIADPLSRLALFSMQRKTPIMVTLQTGKVYVGQCLKAELPKEEKEDFLEIFLFWSGYRDEKQMFINTTDYLSVYAKTQLLRKETKINLSDFVMVVIPIQQIVSAHLYDVNMREHFDKQAAASLSSS